MISLQEEARLVENARAAVKTIYKKLSPEDRAFIEKTEPEKRFIYSDHRYGRAVIQWHLPDCEAGVEYEGEFLTEHMGIAVFTKKKTSEKSDFSRPPVKRRPADSKGRGNKRKRL